jgi:hypothetical protein
MFDMKVDDLIAKLEPFRGKEVYMKCGWRRLDIEEVKVEKFRGAGDFEWQERVAIVPDSGDLFDYLPE